MAMEQLVLGAVAIGLTLVGLGLTVWARKVDVGTRAVEQMSDSIKEIVGIRLGGIQNDVHEIKTDFKTLSSHIQKQAIAHAKLEARFNERNNGD